MEETAAPEGGQLACTMPSTLLRIVRKRLGERGVHALPAKAQVPRTPDYLDDVGGSPRGRAMPPIARR